LALFLNSLEASDLTLNLAYLSVVHQLSGYHLEAQVEELAVGLL